MHHLTCGISSLLHSVNLILFTLRLVHLILRIPPHHSHHLRSHHLPLPRPFTRDLKLIYFTNPFLHCHSLFPSGLPSRILTCTELKGHWRFFVCFSFFFMYFFLIRVLDKAEYSALRVHVKLWYCIVSYRIAFLQWCVNYACSGYFSFYRAMHVSAKRGIAIACRLSVRPSVRLSVCDVGGLWSHRLEFFENNFTVS